MSCQITAYLLEGCGLGGSLGNLGGNVNVFLFDLGYSQMGIINITEMLL